ncbi:MAG: carbohydrate ABC transporter permease [Ruminococcus sp.]|nr:carbohydrate ABC transporter permease [Ruminococcus sp.]
MSDMKSVYGQGKDNYMLKMRIKSTVLFIWFVILTIICLLPIYALIINATRSNNDISTGFTLIPGNDLLDNFDKMLNDPTAKNAFRPLIGYRNSAIITCSATILTVFFSALTSYGIHVYDFKLKDISYTFILLIMMVPTQVTSAGFVEFMISMKLHNTYIPLIIPAIAAPAVIFFMRSYLKSSFPLDIVEAARIDGSGEFRTFLTIAIPMMKPAIAVQAIFAFVANWNNFYTPSMILINGDKTKQTLPMMVQAIQASDKFTDFGIVYTCIALSIVPIVIAYVLLSKWIVGGVALGGVKE